MKSKLYDILAVGVGIILGIAAFYLLKEVFFAERASPGIETKIAPVEINLPN